MTYEPARKRMTQQNNALAAAASAPTDPCADDAFAYLMDYGTGKSQTILDEWGTIADSGGLDGVADLLVLAGKGSYTNWFRDKSDIQPAEIRHMDPRFLERMRVGYWRAGGGVAHRRELERFMAYRDGPRALFVNIEALSTPGRARELITEYADQRWCYAAVDESTSIKGHRSRRGKWLRSIRDKFVVRRIATGLLTPQGPTDIFGQFNFLSPRIVGVRSYADFVGRYCVTRPMTVNKRTFDVIVDYRELDDLHSRIGPYSFRVLKSECLDLEPKKYVMWETEHTPEQRRIYSGLRDDMVAMIEGDAHVSTDLVLTQVMRLHQINAGFVVDEQKKIHRVPSNRERDICEILGQHRGKAVIWSAWRPPIPWIRAALEKEFGLRPNQIAEFHGGNSKTRVEDERRFLGDPECLYMIATPQVGGKGNTWVNADLEIYHSNTNSLEDRYNSEDRLHRKGQINRVTVADLIVPDTVDIKQIRRLRKKITLATTITGEEAREWLI